MSKKTVVGQDYKEALAERRVLNEERTREITLILIREMHQLGYDPKCAYALALRLARAGLVVVNYNKNVGRPEKEKK